MKRILTILLALISFCSIAQQQFEYSGQANGTNTYTVSITNMNAYESSGRKVNMSVCFTNANTGASTINVTGIAGTIGAADIVLPDGSPLSSGDIEAGQCYRLHYNGSDFVLGQTGSGGAGTVTSVDVAVGTAGTDIASSGGPIMSSGTITIDIPTASASNRGALSSTDWSTFNNKVATSRTISTTSPLTGGGDLSANRTFAINDAAADGSTKGAASFTANDFNASSGNISIDYTNGQSSASGTKGFLTGTDWDTFNAKYTPSGSQGDLLYYSGANTLSNLAKNTSATRYLSNTGTSNNPAWAQIDLTNGVTGTLPAANGGSGGTGGAYLLESGGTATAPNTYTFNDNSQAFWTNSFTATTNDEHAFRFGGSYTARNTTSDVLSHALYNPSFTATANSQDFRALSVISSLTTGGFLGVDNIQAYFSDGTSSTSILHGSNNAAIDFSASGNGLIRRNGVSSIQIGANSSISLNPSVSMTTNTALTLNENHSASSGSTSFNIVSFSPVLNFTGTFANGSATLLRLHPTETSLTGLTLYGLVSNSTTALSGFGIASPTATMHVVGTTKLDGSVTLPTAGNGILIKSGTNATFGTATLTAGTVTVNTTKTTASSVIILTSQTDGGTPGFLRISGRSAGTSFTVTSSSGSDTSTFGWLLIEPAP